MNSDLSFILIAAFGAFCQEIIHWFELRNKLDEVEIRKVFTSKFYWMLTVLMIAVSGIGTWILFYEEASPLKRGIIFILGAAFPLIFKQLVQAYKKEERHLGGESKRAYSFQEISKRYFR
jgi:hypothetical protein